MSPAGPIDPVNKIGVDDSVELKCGVVVSPVTTPSIESGMVASALLVLFLVGFGFYRLLITDILLQCIGDLITFRSDKRYCLLTVW